MSLAHPAIEGHVLFDLVEEGLLLLVSLPSIAIHLGKALCGVRVVAQLCLNSMPEHSQLLPCKASYTYHGETCTRLQPTPQS